MTINEIHAAVANSMILFSTAYGLWGLLNYARRRAPDSNYWGTLVVGELLYLVQAALGVLMYLQGLRPARSVHLLYGVLAVITLPAAYTFTRGADDRRASLTFGLVGLFLAGVSLRAITTAG